MDLDPVVDTELTGRVNISHLARIMLQEELEHVTRDSDVYNGYNIEK